MAETPSGPPKVTCSICGKEVFKRSTVAVNGGKRACREHPEAMAEATLKQAAEKVSKEAAEERKQRNWERRERLHDYSTGFGLKCSVCARTGKRTHEIAEAVMMDKARILLRNPKTDDLAAFGQAALKHTDDIEILVLESTEKNKKIMDRIGLQELTITGELIGVFAICRKCLIEHPTLELPPAPDLATMVAVGMSMKPAIDAAFMARAARESAQNN